jgi:hypothetical protein
MPDRRFLDFQNTLNRTLNNTISHVRLLTLASSTEPFVATISYLPPGIRLPPFYPVPLGNGHFLGIRIRLRLSKGAAMTEAASISYWSSGELVDESWIFRYDYERAEAEAGGYQYPVAHLHVNATPPSYRGSKPFPRLHFPTRRLSLEEIIRHLIVEHDVPTLCPQDEALAFLDDQQEEFEKNRTDVGRSQGAERRLGRRVPRSPPLAAPRAPPPPLHRSSSGHPGTPG